MTKTAVPLPPPPPRRKLRHLWPGTVFSFVGGSCTYLMCNHGAYSQLGTDNVWRVTDRVANARVRVLRGEELTPEPVHPMDHPDAFDESCDFS